LNFTL